MKSKLIEMREKYPQTELWTDSFHTADHAYGLTQGITGITTSPVSYTHLAIGGFTNSMIDAAHEGGIDMDGVNHAVCKTADRSLALLLQQPSCNHQLMCGFRYHRRNRKRIRDNGQALA